MAPSAQLMVPNTSDMEGNNQRFFSTILEFTRNKMNTTSIASQDTDGFNSLYLYLLLMFAAAFYILVLVYMNIQLGQKIDDLAEDVRELEQHARISIRILREKEAEYNNARHNWEIFEANGTMERYMDAEKNEDEIYGTYDVEKN